MSSSPHHRVAVMAAGVIAPGAIGIEEFSRAQREGRSAIATVTRFDTEGLRSHRAALVDGFVAKQYIAPMKLRRMNNLSRMGVSACRLAMQDASVEALPLSPSEVGVCLGTTFGPVETSAEYLDEYVAKGASLAPPQLFAESVANAPGSHIAIELGFRGFNVTFTQRESSTLAALLFAASQIVKGNVRAVVAGGVEEINEVVFSVLDRIGALAHQAGPVEEASRPFDRRRNGMVVGEGAAAFLLTANESILTSPPYAWLSGFGVARDSSASISDWGTDPASVARAMMAAVRDAGLSPEDISAVWASANSTVKGDRLEQLAIEALFGDSVPPVVATKGYFGEYAAAGALQVTSALVAMREQALPASPGFEEGEPGLGFEVVRSRRDASLRHILINTLSAGGGVVCAVLSRDRE